MSTPPLIVVTSGEPAGIGPDICTHLAERDVPARLVVVGDPALLAARARQLGLQIALQTVADAANLSPHEQGSLQVLPIASAEPVRAGTLDPGNAAYVLELLEAGVRWCDGRSGSALVTAPVQKSTINEAGIPFTGHTEWLARRTGAARPVMMLTSRELRVALVTTHLPLGEVPAAITREGLEETITILHRELRDLFDIATPRIMVLGLNPHAGESGTLGREELEIIAPCLRVLSGRGLRIVGPVPADTAFNRERLEECDAVLAMYHDQGLPVIKALAFGEVVNVTLGLPIIRTSVDHGTALPLAGTGAARPESLFQAVSLAIELASRYD